MSYKADRYNSFAKQDANMFSYLFRCHLQANAENVKFTDLHDLHNTMTQLLPPSLKGDSSHKNIVINHAPLRDVKVKQNSLPWVISDIRKEMNRRLKLLNFFKGSRSSDLWNKCKESRNKVNHLMRKAESDTGEINSVSIKAQKNSAKQSRTAPTSQRIPLWLEF